ncbi:MAG: hypothetical protein AB1Z57_01435 [Acidimicrobiia bacterium]
MLWLLTIRPTETWTTLTVTLSLALLVVVLIALGWVIGVMTSREDREA